MIHLSITLLVFVVASNALYTRIPLMRSPRFISRHQTRLNSVLSSQGDVDPAIPVEIIIEKMRIEFQREALKTQIKIEEMRIMNEKEARSEDKFKMLMIGLYIVISGFFIYCSLDQFSANIRYGLSASPAKEISNSLTAIAKVIASSAVGIGVSGFVATVKRLKQLFGIKF